MLGVKIRFSAVVLLLMCASAHAQTTNCAGCHPRETSAWSRTGMAGSFYSPKPSEDYRTQAPYYHQPSDTWYEMTRRGDHYFQRQYQKDPAGKVINDIEKQVDFVLGSGNHARTFLHRNPDNTLTQLPLGWYAENGGTWAMNPGYDRPDHQGTTRRITYDCMFCHNGYPQIPTANAAPRALPVFDAVPEGIDCQRCHGSEPHAGTPDPAAELETCMQCHLETTTSPLPASIVRYERQPFSFRPGEPLGDFMLHFDQARPE